MLARPRNRFLTSGGHMSWTCLHRWDESTVSCFRACMFLKICHGSSTLMPSQRKFINTSTSWEGWGNMVCTQILLISTGVQWRMYTQTHTLVTLWFQYDHGQGGIGGLKTISTRFKSSFFPATIKLLDTTHTNLRNYELLRTAFVCTKDFSFAISWLNSIMVINLLYFWKLYVIFVLLLCLRAC